MFDAVQLAGHGPVAVDRGRDALLTDLAKATLADRCGLPGESHQDVFARVASAYGDDAAHAQRLYDYASRLWFVPAAPILARGGTGRGLTVSCFLNEAGDSLDGIMDLWNENARLAAEGAGIGSYWGHLRSAGETLGRDGRSAGVIPFVRVMDSLALAVGRDAARPGGACAYLPVAHPEIEEFVELRRPAGDPDRRAPNLHHGVLVSDAFMRAVEGGEEWVLTSPKDGVPVRKLRARHLWDRILRARRELGEPYIVFVDHVNNARPEYHKLAGLEVRTSDHQGAIMLPTGRDGHGRERTAACCLSSLNLENWSAWEDDPRFIPDVLRFLDNVLQSFIDAAPAGMARARYGAMRERTVGLGVTGFHSFLQARGVIFGSAAAAAWNRRIFEHVRARADAASRDLAAERGPCPDAAEYGFMERFSNKLAVAPTASISAICGGASAGIEPVVSNVIEHETSSGRFVVRNPRLRDLLAAHGRDDKETWATIAGDGGSVRHLDFLDPSQKDVFATAFEIDQRWVIEHAAGRSPLLCQSQSVDLFLRDDADADELARLHVQAWRSGVKSLHRCRVESARGAATST